VTGAEFVIGAVTGAEFVPKQQRLGTVVGAVVASSWAVIGDAAAPRRVRRRERFGELVQPLEQHGEGEQQHEPDRDQCEDWDLKRRGEQWGSLVGGEARWQGGRRQGGRGGGRGGLMPPMPPILLLLLLLLLAPMLSTAASEVDRRLARRTRRRSHPGAREHLAPVRADVWR
jgi:hypothetical protein